MKVTKIFWLFGRSGAGKTTLARRLREGFLDRGVPVFYLDGDEMRSGLTSDLGFTTEARLENHRRIAEVARLAAGQGLNAVVATMAPQNDQRDIVAKILGARLVWVYIHAPLEVCIARDPKGLYRRAEAGKVANLLNFPFDEPRPHEREHYIDTAEHNVDDCHRMLHDLARIQLSDYVI